MKTKNFLLPAMALLVGTLLSTPLYAQDYHDEVENIKKDINIERPTITPYLNVGLLHNQMFEDLSIDYEKLLEAATNSVKDNKISANDQYELMVFAIQTNHNEVLGTLLEAGFKVNIDVELSEAGTKVAPLTEIAQEFQNEHALFLIDIYARKARFKRLPFPKKIEPMPQGEHMQIMPKRNSGSALIKRHLQNSRTVLPLLIIVTDK